MLVVCIIVISSLSSLAMAKNWDSPPPMDQVKPGDTLYKGDGNVKIFDRQGRMIYSGPEKGFVMINGEFDNGNYGGKTDIWWVYGDLLGTNSGPKGEGATWGYGMPHDGYTDYVYVRTILSTQDLGRPWVERDQDTAFDFNTNSVTCYVQCLEFTFGACATMGCKGESKHIVQDAEEGWDATFYTDDAF